MQQRGVIVTAVILALILAGALWYTLTRNNADTATPTASPTPSPMAIESLAPISNPTFEGTTGEPTSSPSIQAGEAVAPTAASGARENLVGLLVLMTGAGLWHITQTLRRAITTR